MVCAPYKVTELGIYIYLNFLQKLVKIMAMKELKKPSFLLGFALLLLLLMMMISSQSMADAEMMKVKPTKARTRKVLEMEQDYPGEVPSIPSDYDYNDFYRRQGDVPSPGIGH
ncbi:hypothetical protein ES332_D13G008400v1 [Gossypium tomentosum]|uniref:Uncharacterized protein n=1 Tax=Gossypium tomentosum TaxID=34277 RepID=A0A5D2HRK8_GOSTO|nr:hypothetical protein ES332_D13G008400v1 [Gossypium tomentosum]